VIYSEQEFKPLPLPGFWRFLNWLPCEGWNENFRSETLVYKSSGLAEELGLNNLYIAFNGYWPEKGADMRTCTFKELESPPTFQRATEKCIDNLIIASAGNTAKAFIYAAQYYQVELFVVVPYSCIGRLVLPIEVPPNVRIISVNSGSDYSDSIAFSRRMSQELNIMPEGGARNVARRDGMGTVMLQAAFDLKCLPDHYFQAVGSGTGSIAVWEEVERLLNDPSFSKSGIRTKLHMAQNLPFTPMVDAWKQNLKMLIEIDLPTQRNSIKQVYAKVLTNRQPPYSIGGGIYDTLIASSGSMYGVSNDEAFSAGNKFEKLEGIDLVPAACVAVSSLEQAVTNGSVKPDELILLNITGGGEKRLWEDFKRIPVKPDIICDDEIDMKDLKDPRGEINGR